MPRTNRPKWTIQKCGYGKLKGCYYREQARHYLDGNLPIEGAPSVASLRRAGRDPHVQAAAARSVEAVAEILVERHPGADLPGVADFLYLSLRDYMQWIEELQPKGRPRLTLGELADAHRRDNKPEKVVYHRAIRELAGAVMADNATAVDVQRLVNRAGRGGWKVNETRAAKPWGSAAIKKLLGTLVDAYRYGAGHGLVAVEAAQRIEYAAGLPVPEWIGRPEGKSAVPDSIIDATLQECRQHEVRDLIALQRLTGARPGELCAMHTDEIDRTGEVWIYSPRQHKTAKIGKRRTVFIGPRAQEILAPRLARRKPFALSPTQYRERVHAAARKAGVEQWGPNQIRHSVSNEVKRKYGRDGEAVFLGHTADVAEEHYLETEVPLGVRIAKEIG